MEYITKPQLITPAYNPIVYRVYDSTYSEPGFKYVYRVTLTDDLVSPEFTNIHEFTVSPDINGYGKLDIQKLVAANIRPIDLNTVFKTMEQKWNNVYFTTEIGYEKSQSFSFTSMTTITIDNKKYVKLIDSNSYFLFVKGDQISITVDNPTNNTYISMVGGIHSVIDAGAGYATIDVIIPIDGTLPTTTGTIEYADGRKNKVMVASEDIPNVGNIWHSGYNMSLPFIDLIGPVEFLQWNFGDYSSVWNGLTMSNTTLPKMLTSVTDNHILTTNERCLINFALINYPHSYVTIKIESLDGFFSYNYNMPVVAYNNQSYMFTKYYTVDVLNPNKDFKISLYSLPSSGEPLLMFQPRTFNLDTRCRISNWTLLFQDRFGAMSSFAFPARIIEKGEVARVEMQQFYERYKPSNGDYTYEYGDRGNKVISTSNSKTFELNTYWNDWDDKQSRMWEELLISPYVYLDLDEHTYFGQAIINTIAVTIKDTSYEVVRNRNKNIQRKTITIVLANNDPSNI